MSTGGREWQNSCQETFKLHLCLSERWQNHMTSNQTRVLIKTETVQRCRCSCTAVSMATQDSDGAVRWREREHLRWKESEYDTHCGENATRACLSILSQIFASVRNEETESLCHQFKNSLFSQQQQLVKSHSKTDPVYFHNTHSIFVY